uniref:Uncharacterized protein n=1 Tax=Fagus sylvatica TaxID=28930 RepID=A0A2N9HLJ7_FAGSY
MEQEAMDKTKDLYNLHEFLDLAIGFGPTLKGATLPSFDYYSIPLSSTLFKHQGEGSEKDPQGVEGPPEKDPQVVEGPPERPSCFIQCWIIDVQVKILKRILKELKDLQKKILKELKDLQKDPPALFSAG